VVGVGRSNQTKMSEEIVAIRKACGRTCTQQNGEKPVHWRCIDEKIKSIDPYSADIAEWYVFSAVGR
jgi:hypothetical protein